MRKDEAMDIAFQADSMSLEQLLEAYGKFQEIVTNTPIVIQAGLDHDDHPHTDYDEFVKEQVYTDPFTEGLHAAIGLSTEAAEILDAYKKDMFGKRKPISRDNMIEEAGDVFFYLNNHMRAWNITFHDILKDNVKKLANRYIDKLGV